MNPLLVTGATGTVGRRVVQALRRRGLPVRAFVRDAERAAALLGPDVELSLGDFERPDSLAVAMAGIERVFLTSANGPDQVRHEGNVIDAAAGSGVQLLVKLSTVGAEAGSSLPGLDWHGRIEEHLRRSGLTAVILRANLFMSNLLASADAIAAGTLAAPAGDGKAAMIDPDDVAAAAAAILAGVPGRCATFELTGPEAVGHDQIAAALTAATGRLVRYVDLPADQARSGFAAAGLPDWLVTHLDGAYRLLRSGSLDQVSGAALQLTGQPPSNIASYVVKHMQHLGVTGDPAGSPSEVAARFIDGINRGDLDALVTLYDADAILHWPAGTTTRGRTAIRAVLGQLIGTRPRMTGHVEHVLTADDTAMSVGSWTMRGVAPDGTPFSASGHTADVLRRQPDNSWRMIIDNPVAAIP